MAIFKGKRFNKSVYIGESWANFSAIQVHQAVCPNKQAKWGEQCSCRMKQWIPNLQLWNAVNSLELQKTLIIWVVLQNLDGVNMMNFPKLEDAWFIMILHAGGERRKAYMTKKRNWEVKVLFWTFGLCNQSESIEQWLRSTAVGWWLLRWWYYPIYTGLIIIHSPPKL